MLKDKKKKKSDYLMQGVQEIPKLKQLFEDHSLLPPLKN